MSPTVSPPAAPLTAPLNRAPWRLPRSEHIPDTTVVYFVLPTEVQ